jgi:hypothetical protein
MFVACVPHEDAPAPTHHAGIAKTQLSDCTPGSQGGNHERKTTTTSAMASVYDGTIGNDTLIGTDAIGLHL